MEYSSGVYLSMHLVRTRLWWVQLFTYATNACRSMQRVLHKYVWPRGRRQIRNQVDIVFGSYTMGKDQGEKCKSFIVALLYFLEGKDHFVLQYSSSTPFSEWFPRGASIDKLQTRDHHAVPCGAAAPCPGSRVRRCADRLVKGHACACARIFYWVFWAHNHRPDQTQSMSSIRSDRSSLSGLDLGRDAIHQTNRHIHVA